MIRSPKELPEALVQKCCDLARQAGARIMKFYGSDMSVVLKKDASPLTAADQASHELLTDALAPLLPGVPVISEESFEATSSGAANERFWLVDPLDGTKEFLKATDQFTVNVALIDGGRSVLGVVYAPALDLIYYGRRGSGAWRQEGTQTPCPISVRPADTSCLSVVASKDHAGPMVQAMLDRMPGAELQSMGSSLKFCLVAEGKADVYLRDLPTMEWDTAAAQCVVEAAGGGVYELSGQPLHYGKPSLKNSSIMTVGDVAFPWQRYLSGASAPPESADL